VQHKSLSIEKIGSLTIDEKKQSSHLPLQFQYDKKARTTPELINYIAERTGKNKVLIQSDLEFYTESMRQLMNIGKSHEIEGVGVFKLAQSGEYEFSVYQIPAGKEEHKATKKQQKSSLIPADKRGSDKSVLMVLSLIIILGILGVIGWGTYNFFVNNTNGHNTDTVVTTTPQINDSLSSMRGDTIFSNTDSDSSIKDTTQRDTISVVKADTADYKFIFETTSSAERANSRTNQLIRYGNHAGFDSVATDTGKIYRLYLKRRLNYADTASVRDSLERYLQSHIKIVRTN